MKSGKAILAILIVQFMCAFFFLSQALSGILGFRTAPIEWWAQEMLEVGAALGLVLGSILGAIALRRSIGRQLHAESQMRAASGAFLELLEESFENWGLTRSERDVALFSIKGLSISEIADMRQTSQGTVKAQTNSIYRKAGVSGRPQLLSLFIEDLMGEALIEPAQNPAEPVAIKPAQ